MKTSISIPEEIFGKSGRLAKNLKISRSAIFAMAIEKLVEVDED
jgi:predicted transcriptional regulator